jgi:hypothetical protein
MAHSADVEMLDQDRLLSEWRWLCPQPATIIDRSVYGDLFLRDELGRIHMLDVGSGELALIADSVAEFEERGVTPEKRNEWFSEADANEAAELGLVPGPKQCIAFDIPAVFKESAKASPYVADIYDYIGFLGDLHRQIAALPDGAKVKLVIKPPIKNA